MIGVCYAADEANRMDDTANKGFGFGDRVYQIIHHLESAAVVLLGPHIMVEQKAMGVPTEMAEFYEIFRVNDEGTCPQRCQWGCSTWPSGSTRTPPSTPFTRTKGA